MTSKIAIIPKGVLSASSTSLVSRDSTKSGVELENTTALSFLKLPHPRTDLPALFLPFSSESSVDREEQILEVQAVNPPASRSWFTDDNTVLEDGRLLLLTPIDPMFLLLPILRLANPSIESGTFQTIDAIFEAASQKVYEQQLEIGENTDDIPNYKDIILLSRMNFVPSALSRICDCQELEDSTKVYRFSFPVTLKMLQVKVNRLSSPEMAASTRIIARSLSKDGLGPNEHVDDKLREGNLVLRNT
ncbi:hypothetical protein FRC16_005593 [Serendipita sp. 398]|nr:hypothetical protein FRC16_005593 [Serendipita sp. 398]